MSRILYIISSLIIWLTSMNSVIGCVTVSSDITKISHELEYLQIPSDLIDFDSIIISTPLDNWRRVGGTGFAKPVSVDNYLLKYKYCESVSNKTVGLIKSNSGEFVIWTYDTKGTKQTLFNSKDNKLVDRKLTYRYPAFVIEHDTTQQQWIYIYADTKDGNIRLPLIVADQKSYSKYILSEELATGLFYGVLFLILLIASVLWILSRDNIYVYYSLILIGFIIFFGCKFGHFLYYFWPDKIGLNNTIIFLGLLLHVIGLGLTCVRILNLNEKAPYYSSLVHAILIFFANSFVVLGFLFNFYPSIDINIGLKVIQVGTILFPIVVIWISTHLYIKTQSSTSLLLLISFSFSIIFLILYTLVPFGWVSVYAIDWFKWLPIAECVFILGALASGYINNKRKYDEAILANLNQEKANKESIVKARRAERQKISNFLHNRIGLKLGASKLLIGDQDFKLSELIDNIATDIRNMSHNLNPEILNQKGLTQTIYDELYRIEDIYTDITITCEVVQFDEEGLSDTMVEVLFHCFLELLQNILKHSDTTLLNIELVSINDRHTLRIMDNSSIAYAIDEDNPGSGLKRIISELGAVNGKFEINHLIPKGLEHLITL